MSDKQPMINKIESPAKGQSPPSAPQQHANRNMGYVLALLLGLGVAGAAGFFGGQSIEGDNAVATLDEITQVAIEHDRKILEANNTATAIVLAYTATPSPTVTATATATSEVPIAQVLPFTVSVYEFAGTEHSVMAMLAQGSSVEVLRITTDELWYEISYLDSEDAPQIGYIPAQSLQLMDGSLAEIAFVPTVTDTPIPTNTPRPPSATPFPTYTPTPEVPIAQVRSAVIQVHSGADGDYPVLDTLQQEQVVELIGVSEDGLWYEVAYVMDDETQTGFVLGRDLNRIAGALASVPMAIYPSLTPLPSETAILTLTQPQVKPIAQILIVREGPHPNFPAVGAINANNYLRVSGLTQDKLWAQVEFSASPNGFGWVALDRVIIEGDITDLPLIDAPPAPVAPPIQIIIDGSEISAVPSSNTGNSNPPVSAGNIEIANLPANASSELPDLSIYDTYAFEMRIVMNGEDNLQTYADTVLQILLAEDTTLAQSQSTLTGHGDWFASEDEDLNDFLPIIGGVIEGQGYLYLKEDDFCYADDEDFTADLFVDFPVIYDNTAELVVAELDRTHAIFGMTDMDNLLGIPAHHYQFLGYEGATAESGYQPTTNTRIDLWYSVDEQILFAFNMYFNFSEESNTPDNLIAIFLGNETSFNNYMGMVELYFQPLILNGDVTEFLVPPSDCEYLFD